MNRISATLIFLLFLAKTLHSQALYPGDLAVVGISSNTFFCGGPNDGDEVSFFCFKDILPGTSIDITDNGYERCFAGKWGDEEGIVRFTRTGTPIPAGTIITYRTNGLGSWGSYLFVAPDGLWSATNLNVGTPPATPVNINGNGDQLQFLSGGNWNNIDGPSGNNASYSGYVICGFNTTNTWSPSCNPLDGHQHSALHPDLETCFHLEPFPNTDFVKYTGISTPTDRFSWYQRLRDPANWTSYANCAGYITGLPAYASGLVKFDILPIEASFNQSAVSVCQGDTAFVSLDLPDVGGPFNVILTDGIANFPINQVLDGGIVPLAPTQSTNYSIASISNANQCSILGLTTGQLNVHVIAPDTLEFTQISCNPLDTGIYFDHFSNQFGCDSTVLRTVKWNGGSCQLQLTLDLLAVTCIGRTDGVMRLTMTEGLPPFTFNWQSMDFGTNGSGNMPLLYQPAFVENLQPGSYAVTIIDATGLDTTFIAEIQEPTQVSVKITPLTDFNGYTLPCAGSSTGQLEAIAMGGSSGYNYFWNPAAAGSVISVFKAGWVHVTVTDSRGCQAIDSLDVQAPSPLDISLEAIEESCLGAGNGIINVTNISGGVGPYLMGLDSGHLNFQTKWDSLPSGQYQLIVQDANQCRDTLYTYLPEGVSFNLWWQGDTVLFTGDTVELQFGSSRENVVFSWSPDYAHAVTGDGTILFYPLSTTNYLLTARDSLGCLSKKQVKMTVLTDRSYYFPNVFYPNAQEFENSFFTLYSGKGIAEIAYLRIYDRYGSMIFEKQHFPTNDASLGWDGRYKGKLLNPGIFVWQAEIINTDGNRRKFAGDLLLVE